MLLKIAGIVESGDRIQKYLKMKKNLERVAIYSKDNNSKTRLGVNRLVNEFCRRGIKILICQKSEDPIVCPGGQLIESFTNLSDASGLPDLVLSVGGDGTFLETVLKIKELEIPIAGVNTGRMGFLANISEEELSHSIDMLCQGEFEIIERMSS